MKIYLAGRMSGVPYFNFPAFNAAAAELRRDGHEVFNPAERDIERHGGVDISKGNATGDVAQAVKEHGFDRRAAMADDLDYIMRHADAIAFLHGWEDSEGARLERRAAQFANLEMMYLPRGYGL